MGENEKKKKIEPYESERRGDYSSKLEYLTHNYMADRKLPWGRYILLYLFVVSAIVFLIYEAVGYFPRRLTLPQKEPVVIDKLGCFDNKDELLKELGVLQERCGAYFAIASIPDEEYETVKDNVHYMTDVYKNYFDDEDHIFIYVAYTGYNYEVNVRAGANAKSIIEHIPLERTIDSRISGQSTVAPAVLDSLNELDPLFMSLQKPFYIFIALIIGLVGFTIWHIRRYIVRRLREERLEQEKLEEMRKFYVDDKK